MLDCVFSYGSEIFTFMQFQFLFQGSPRYHIDNLVQAIFYSWHYMHCVTWSFRFYLFKCLDRLRMLEMVYMPLHIQYNLCIITEY